MRTVKKLIFIVVANVIVLSLLFAVGEFAVRWRVRGGPVEAIQTFWDSARENSARRPSKNNWLIADPVIGYTLNPANEKVSSLGVRHRDLPAEKAEGEFRVIFLGDSVSWDQDGFVAIARQRFGELRDGPVEVINAAIPGYTTYQERMLLERNLIGLNPDLVVLQYCMNDNHKFLHTLDERGGWLLTPEAQGMMIPGEEGWFGRFLRSSYLVTKLRMHLYALIPASRVPFAWEPREDVSAAWRDETWPDYETHVTAMRDRLNRINARFCIVIVPFAPQLEPAPLYLDKQYTLKPQRKITEICGRLGVPVLDVTDIFIENREKILYRDAIHLNPLGHQLIAEQLLAFLKREGLAATR